MSIDPDDLPKHIGNLRFVVDDEDRLAWITGFGPDLIRIATSLERGARSQIVLPYPAHRRGTHASGN